MSQIDFKTTMDNSYKLENPINLLNRKIKLMKSDIII